MDALFNSSKPRKSPSKVKLVYLLIPAVCLNVMFFLDEKDVFEQMVIDVIACICLVVVLVCTVLFAKSGVESEVDCSTLAGQEGGLRDFTAAFFFGLIMQMITAGLLYGLVSYLLSL